MTDDELEQRLRAHYDAIDPVLAPPDLAPRIEAKLARRSRRPISIASNGPAIGTALAAIIIVAVALGMLPGGFLSSPGASARPSQSPSTTSAATSSARSSASPSTAPSEAAGAVATAGTFRGGGVWAIQGSTLLISADAGASWRRNSIPVSDGPLAPAVTVLDADHAWSITYGPGTTEQTGSPTDVLRLVVDRTVDGGRTWQTAAVPGNYPGTSQALVFLDARHGFLLCAPMRFSSGVSTTLETADGGATWSPAGIGDWLGSMFSASDAVTLWSGAEQEAGPVLHPILDVSRDGGATWQDARLPGLEGQNGGAQTWLAGPPSFADPANGLVTVDSSDGEVTTTRIYRTVDAGRSWSLATDRPVEASAAVAVLDTDHGLLPVVNPTGLLMSSDGGGTWQNHSLSDLTVDEWMTWIGAVDASHAAALVPTEHSSAGPLALYLSGDAGETWRPADFGTPTNLSPSPSQ